jgi:alanine racemase
MKPHHQLGIFEAGISRPGEMENLEGVIRPTIGIFTNIGSAHDEGFVNQDQKIDEKLKLFKHSQILIYCSDQENVKKAIQRSGIKGFSWGTTSDADIKVSFQGNACYLALGKKSKEALTIYAPCTCGWR